MIQKKYDKFDLKIYQTRNEMGKAAADEAAACIQNLLSRQDEINIIFAAAPSQKEFLSALVATPSIEWPRINAYHMDEYVGFGIDDTRSFQHFLSEAIFSRVPFKSVNLINGANDPDAEAARYGTLLDKAPTHIAFMGIGENGHIAFNDPPTANFRDEVSVKKVQLDEICRQQQINDGCFPSLNAVPRFALTVTVPRLAASQYIFCIVPTAKKGSAVYATLTGPIDESCPASILRRTEHVSMYIDTDCAKTLSQMEKSTPPSKL